MTGQGHAAVPALAPPKDISLRELTIRRAR